MGVVAIYIWHDGRSRFDTVEHHPGRMTRLEARALAHRVLMHDASSTRVQVHYLEGKYEEAARLLRQVRRIQREALASAS